MESELFRFENINWFRVIVDEGHEIFKFNYNYAEDRKKLSNEIYKNLSCEYNWYVSGTPFFDKTGLTHTMDFLNFKTDKSIRIRGENRLVNLNFDEVIKEGIIFDNLTSSIYKQIYVRNTKESVKDMLSIPPAIEETIFLNFSNFEKKLYNSISKSRNDLYLRQLCCNIQINNKFQNHESDQVLNFDEVKEKIIRDNKEKINKTKQNILNLNSSIPGYQARKNDVKYNFCM